MVRKQDKSNNPTNIRIPSVYISFRQISIATLTLFLATISILFYVNFKVATEFVIGQIEILLTWTGLGIVPILFSICLIFWSIRSGKLRSYILRNKRIVIGLYGLIIALWGISALYTPTSGFPGWTTGSSAIPVGGNIGTLIIGSNVTHAVIRLLIISISSIVIIKPSLVHLSWNSVRKLMRVLYSCLAALIRYISGMYEKDGSTRALEAHTEGLNVEDQYLPADLLTPHMRESEIIGDISDMEVEIEKDENRISSDHSTSSSSFTKPENFFVSNKKSQDYEARSSLADSGILNASHRTRNQDVSQKDGAKFNKFWINQKAESRIHAEVVNSAGKLTQRDSTPNTKIEDITSPSPGIANQWKQPELELLNSAEELGISPEEIEATSRTIKTTFAEYRVEIEVEKVRPGPAVTMYGIEPGWVRKSKRVRIKDKNGNPKLDEKGKPLVIQREDKTRVSVDNILRREKDLSLALKTPSLRIETPVMGESLLGIEVPNPNPSLVSLRKVMESNRYRSLKGKTSLPVALGRGSDGEEVVFDLARMPHMLIAGSTGSGKSVCMNAIISCLLMVRNPSELQMLLIDPKRVELTPYNGIPHLITPVVVETDGVVNLLKGLIAEMMDRYRTMEEVGVRNIESFNQKMPGKKMPYLVVAIDELADLMMTAAFDIEQSICRLAQLGRATGIHLLIATQRPSVDVITGLIKANFPSRISFAVTSQIDSRTILDNTGAERLLGRGDMLYQPIDGTRPTRVQSVFISDSEIQAIVEHWKNIPSSSRPQINLATLGNNDFKEEANISPGHQTRDQLADRAIELAHRHTKLSTSLLQRRLRIGYPRAARLMDELEDMGIVGPGDGSKSRDVIIS